MRKVKVTDIKYDTDGCKVNLPKSLEIEIPDNIKDEDELEEYVSDEISNITGYCHFGFSLND